MHYTANETIGGVEYHWIPEVGDVPLVSDMSSCILSRPLDISRFGLIYAGAQKNIGPAGLTIVIIRDDLLGIGDPAPSLMLDYVTHAKAESMHNTPPTYAIYIAGLVFKHLLATGGLAAAEQRNIAKSALLYDYLDSSDFYANPVEPSDRSRMNVPFTLADAGLDADFLAGAKERGMVQLKGHRSVGGMRASIYNAMPIEGVQALVDYMSEFAAGTDGRPAMSEKFRVRVLNHVSASGLQRLGWDRFAVSAEIDDPHAILLRSADLHGLPVQPSLLAVGRAGAGTNNIPVPALSARGIPVFNAPGANANAVKELVVAGMLLAARNLDHAWRTSRA